MIKKIKVLFLIHDLGQGGAEKVLVNLVNNINEEQFDITVMTLFGGGINEQFLKPEIHLKSVWKRMIPGNSHWLKLLSPVALHNLLIRDNYDIEIAYLEGPDTRIISGCTNKKTKLIAWIHGEQNKIDNMLPSYRNMQELVQSYKNFNKIVTVSETIRQDIRNVLSGLYLDIDVLYNTIESDKILELSKRPVDIFLKEEINIITVGSLKPVKALDRLIRVHAKLRESGYPIHTYILGQGPQKDELEKLALSLGVNDTVTLLGYDTNPYKYVAKADIFVCSSLREGFSTAVTEALIVGTPVCTTEVSGMKELLGENNEYGIIVQNDEDALYEGVCLLVTDKKKREYYASQAQKRGSYFSTEETVTSVQELIKNVNNLCVSKS